MLFTKPLKDLKDEEYILKYCFIYLNMRKVKEESITKILEHEDNKSAFDSFIKTRPFLFAKAQGAEMLVLSTDPPNMDKEAKGKKSILIVKCCAKAQDDQMRDIPFPNGISKDIVFMELNKPILENLLATC
jgi:hypothetical protein